MDGEQNGSQENPQEGAENQPSAQTSELDGNSGNTGNDYEKQIADRDAKIASLEAQIAEAAKTAEEKRRAEAEAVKAAEAKLRAGSGQKTDSGFTEQTSPILEWGGAAVMEEED